MLKNILNLEGVAVLKRDEQKSINGGLREPKCVLNDKHEFLYSPEGQVVAEKCGWTCGDEFRWGGCPIQ